MQQVRTQISVTEPDRRVFDAVCESEKRGRGLQFSVLLDVFCETRGFHRDTGQKIESDNGRPTRSKRPISNVR